MPDFTIGAPLPRAEDAYATRKKWQQWILAERGHGREWARVLHATPQDAAALWLEIARGILTASISLIRDREGHGIACEALLTISLNGRRVRILTSWHYIDGNSAPRLVTAYPRP
jgi:hypothetical protein